MKLIPWLVVLSLGLVGCSGSKSAQNVSQDTPQIELSDADEFIENPNEEPMGDFAEAPLLESTEPFIQDQDPLAPTETMEDPMVASTPMFEEPAAPVESTTPVEPAAPVISNELTNEPVSGGEKIYKVQKNETLMLIAFKLYGDYAKWKDLASYNSDALKGNAQIREGMELKYIAPAQEFVWNPQGLPYLIRTGDTLGGISGNVYGTLKKWKLIWDNNRPLIKDPNKIFAGFTLYYLENGREVAAEI